MLNLILATLLSYGPTTDAVYEPFRNPNLGDTICADQGPNGWKLSGDFHSVHTDWEANQQIGELIGDGNCQFGWTITETVDNRISYEMPHKFCPPVYHWTFTSPFGVVVEGATTPIYPCRVVKPEPEKLDKPLTSKGKNGGSTGGSTSEPEDEGTDDDDSTDGDGTDGDDSTNGNGGNGGSCNNGIGNGGDGCDPGNSGNGANGGQDG